MASLETKIMADYFNKITKKLIDFDFFQHLCQKSTFSYLLEVSYAGNKQFASKYRPTSIFTRRVKINPKNLLYKLNYHFKKISETQFTALTCNVTLWS